MNCYWLRDRMNQEKVSVYWDNGERNNADQYTKHHYVKTHVQMRRKHVRDK